MNYIERAIILAAGYGKRMHPVTLYTPKPLIKVNGTVMIESIIDGLHKNDITEIYIVVGYMKDKFNYLLEKYNGLTFIENPYYNIYNNISSLYVARHYIENAIILDGDQLIYNPDILHREFTLSGYSSLFTVDKTDEWLQHVDNNGIVKDCSRVGGDNGWQLFSISRWTKDDGKLLSKYVEKEFINKNYNIYWDDIAMFLYKDKFKLGIYEISKDDIVEIDTLKELINIDDYYKKYEGQ